MRRVYRRKRPFEYLLPFLIFVGVGVIGVLGFQLWNSLQGAKGDVYFYIAAGKAKMLEYGVKEWETAYSGTKMFLGDSVKTSMGSRGVLQFFNGTVVRMDEDTEIVITDITKRSDVEKIGMTLNHGNVWINKVQTEGVDESDFQVRTSHLQVSDVGTVFEVESNTVETVRVIQGSVNVQILDTDEKKTLLDTVQVGVGQEMNLDEAILKAFQNRETPSVLMALSDQFKLSDWYIWNMREDQSPTDFTIHHDLPLLTEEAATLEVNAGTQQAGSTMETTGNPVPLETSGLQTPVITQPSSSSMSTDQNKVTISGTVGQGTAKVVVRQTVSGNTDEYTLSKFKAGDTSFSYNVSEALGNFRPGQNIYNFYAVDASGKKSDSAEIRITYNKTAVEVTDTLTAPKVVSYNGGTSNTVTVSVVKVDGSVAGAEKVVVNGYTLGKFVAGSKTWTYFANEEGGNLKPGLNEYEVYAVDPQGVKSTVTTFTITYNKPAGTATTSGSSTTTTSSGGATQDVPQGF
jgi:hypothetical protein